MKNTPYENDDILPTTQEGLTFEGLIWSFCLFLCQCCMSIIGFTSWRHKHLSMVTSWAETYDWQLSNWCISMADEWNVSTLFSAFPGENNWDHYLNMQKWCAKRSADIWFNNLSCLGKCKTCFSMSARSKFKMSSFLYGVIISCFCREVIQIVKAPENITAYVIGYTL